MIESSGARAGVAYLVGAGPGDIGLMSVRAAHLVATADAILYDRLLPAGALDDAREDAELIYVGKAPGEEAMAQSEIESRLIEIASAGRSVVRLKGGDPFVFGRGGEEAEALAAAGVPFEVTPGITAGIAAPAYAGIPVTHRDDASAVAFVTGHEDPGKPESALDWQALAAFPGTLVLYMGVKNLTLIAERLIAAGRDADQPAAAIERGTHPGQRTVVATTATLPAAVAEAGLRPPSILLFGSVAARSEAIGWLEQRPLHGRRVVVTRARAQASGLARTLSSLGAEVIELPSIRIEPRLEDPEVSTALATIEAGDYSLVCLTSPNAVVLLCEAVVERGLDARAFGGVTIAAIGPGTARELRSRGVIADVIAERSVAESLVEALADVDVSGRRVLIARAAEARDVLPDALRERGAEVDIASLYETVTEKIDAALIEAAREADYVTFTSSSTVRNYVDGVGADVAAAPRVVSIGPVTSDTARELGLEVAVEAERHDPEGLVEALLADTAAEDDSAPARPR